MTLPHAVLEAEFRILVTASCIVSPFSSSIESKGIMIAVPPFVCAEGMRGNAGCYHEQSVGAGLFCCYACEFFVPVMFLQEYGSDFVFSVF